MNREWTLKELAKYPPALIFVAATFSALIYLMRLHVRDTELLAAKNNELVVCQQQRADIIISLKDEQIKTIARMQYRQDSLLAQASINQQEIQRLKKRIK